MKVRPWPMPNIHKANQQATVSVPDGYWFWLREADAVRLYAEDKADLPDDVVDEALWRDLYGDRELAADTVVRLLERFARGRLVLSGDTVAAAMEEHLRGRLTLDDAVIEGLEFHGHVRLLRWDMAGCAGRM